MYTVNLPIATALSEAEALAVCENLSECGFSVSVLKHDERWNLHWVFENKPDTGEILSALKIAAPQIFEGIKAAANDFLIEKIPEDFNWLAETYKQFPAFTVGPFYIYGSHCKEPVPDTQMGLQIDAATAFGSGEHGTTKGCLMAMLDIKAAGACPWNILDMGTGSGILGIAAWKLWKSPVLAIDNDIESVRVTEVHAEINKIPMKPTDFTAAHGEGFATQIVQERKPFDLIIANILAGPLREMAQDLIDVCDNNGHVILSGILNEQADDVIKSYGTLSLKRRHVIGEWTTLTLQKI